MITDLATAVRVLVEPGMHLHLASTPARSNAAIRELGRAFRGTRPAFTLSSTGFHSTAHLLGLLRLGARYIGCFYGDNHPAPRPNRLYAVLRKEGVELEHWSLLMYVTALRAAALGQPYGVVHGDANTDLRAELVRRGRLVEVPDPQRDGGTVSLVEALAPDVAFVHVPLADATGACVAATPHGDGFWGALAARHGVVVTAERVVPAGTLPPGLCRYGPPRHRVLAVTEAPLGAHPQPLCPPAEARMPGYPDDFAHYALWRAMAEDPVLFAAEFGPVLAGDDDARVYADFISRPSVPPPRREDSSPAPSEVMIVKAARHIAARVQAGGYRVLLAGIGHAFTAVRMAALALADAGFDVPVMVETGLYDVDCRPPSSGFLLGYDTVVRSARVTSIEEVLGALAGGAGNRCLAVIGAAQVDGTGDVNSTMLAGGRPLVGSGGAADLAALADEVVVLCAARPDRLVRKVDHVTSSGGAVRSVVTDLGTFHRTGPGARWRLADQSPCGSAPEACAWDPAPVPDTSSAAAPGPNELFLLRSLSGERAGPTWRERGRSHA